LHRLQKTIRRRCRHSTFIVVIATFIFSVFIFNTFIVVSGRRSCWPSRSLPALQRCAQA